MAYRVPEYISQLSVGSMPKIQPTGLESQAQTSRGISAELSAVAQDMQQKSNEIEVLRAQSAFQTKMSEFSQQFGSDPAGFRAAADGFKKGYIANIGSREMAAKLEARYELDIAPYIDRATQNLNNNLNSDLKYQVYNKIDTSLRKIREISSGLTSDIPEVRQHSARSLQLILSDVDEASFSTGVGGQRLVSAERAFAFKDQVKREALTASATSYIQNAQNPIEAMQKWASGGVTFLLPGGGTVQDAPVGELYAALEQQESGGRQFDSNGAPVESSAGAIGVWQVMPDTAKEAAKLAGVKFDEEKYRTDANYNRTIGKAYLNAQIDKYNGNRTLGLMAYNAGPGAVDDFMNGTNKTGKNKKKLRLGDPTKGEVSIDNFVEAFPFEETRNYVRSISSNIGGVNVNIREQMTSSDAAAVDKIALDRAEQYAMQLKVGAAVGGAAVLDPKNKDDRDAVDQHFKESLANFQRNDETGASIEQVAMGLIKQYGMVPLSLQSQMRAGLRSANPEEVVARANQIQQLRSENPVLIDDFSSEDLRIANTVTALISSGHDPKDAVIRTMDLLKTSPDIIEQRKLEYQDDPIDAKGAIEGECNNLFWPDPDVPELMKRDFERLASTEYELTGSRESAKKTALDNITRVWSKSGVGTNDGWVKNPPEKYYSAPVPTDNTKWMNEQLGEDFGVEPERLVVSDANRKVNGKPVYTVYKLDDFNRLEKFDKLWRPEWEASKASKDYVNEDEMKIKAARSRLKGEEDRKAAIKALEEKALSMSPRSNRKIGVRKAPGSNPNAAN